MRDNVVLRIPIEEEELHDQYHEAKKEVVALFQKKAVGSVADEYIKELKIKLKTTY